jgi:hypothetical protein
LTSLSIANVGDSEEFWGPAFNLINKNFESKDLDSFLKMNLIWCMARNLSALDPETKQSLIKKVEPTLTDDISSFIQKN